MPDRHDKLVKPHMHPNLAQPSILGYLWRAYVWPGQRLNYDGGPFVWPDDADAPNEDWAFDQDETSGNIGGQGEREARRRAAQNTHTIHIINCSNWLEMILKSTLHVDSTLRNVGSTGCYVLMNK